MIYAVAHLACAPCKKGRANSIDGSDMASAGFASAPNVTPDSQMICFCRVVRGPVVFVEAGVKLISADVRRCRSPIAGTIMIVTA
jgi:hypothetical protein